MEGLEKDTKEKEAEEQMLEEKLEKAAKYMNNVREEWDGSRVETKGSLEQLHHRVCIRALLFLLVLLVLLVAVVVLAVEGEAALSLFALLLLCSR